MSWVTKHLDERTRGFAAVERARPYLVALLLSSERDADRVRARARNWMTVRAAERERPDTVPGRPYHAVLDPSSVCNLRCPLCVQATDPDGRPRGLVDVHHVRAVLHDMADHVIRLDLFNWGEPLLHPAFAELASLAGATSMYVRTSSHMSHRRRIDWDAIAGCGLKYLVASIDGATQETYARYRVGGDLDLAIENLRALVHAKRSTGDVFPIVEWQYLVNRFNEGEIGAAEQLAREIGVDVFRYGGARGAMSRKTLVPASELFQSSKRYLVDPEHPLSEYDPNGEKRRDGERAGCRWLWGKIALQADGGVTPCWNGWFSKDDLASWQRRPVAELWNSSEYQRRRRAVRNGGSADGGTQCERCAHLRNFVPPPDTDAEERPGPAQLAETVDALTGIGRQPCPVVVQAVADGLAVPAAA